MCVVSICMLVLLGTAYMKYKGHRSKVTVTEGRNFLFQLWMQSVDWKVKVRVIENCSNWKNQ